MSDFYERINSSKKYVTIAGGRGSRRTHSLLGMAYKQGITDGIDECINTIVGTQSQIALNEPYDEHLFTVMADRQHEIIDLLDKLKEQNNDSRKTNH